MQNYKELLANLEKHENTFSRGSADPNKALVAEDYSKLLKSFVEEHPAQSGMHMKYFGRYHQHLMQNGPNKQHIDAAIQAYEKCLSFTSNSSNVSMWAQFLDFMEGLEETNKKLQGEDQAALESERELKLKQVFERALENVGFSHMASSEIWIKYIDFETTRNNLSLVNLLCYMALETPLTDGQQILDK